MHIFYQPDLVQHEIFLNEEESKHAVRVLRLKKDDEVELIDGKGTSAVATITDDDSKKCRLNILHLTSHISNRNYHLHIAVAPAKNFERMEWFIEKAVEVGIDQISFIKCSTSERTKVNMERCRKVAVSAMKQSKQFWLPEINDIRKYDEVVKKFRNGDLKLIASCGADISQTLHHFVTQSLNLPVKQSTHQHITILIGPEGDFTKQEVELAVSNGFQPASFGENRLRTETAALYACMAIHTLTS